MTNLAFQSFALFFTALLGGLAFLVIRQPKPATFQLLLVLSGGYLFAITILHLLPEVFAMHIDSRRIGLYILAGFFLQLLLELLSKGVEHGHMYVSTESPHKIAPLSLLLALCVHAFLDGVILSSPTTMPLHEHAHAHTHAHGSGGILLGIILHKLPVSFALTSVLSKFNISKHTIFGYLALFALASPLGLWASHYCGQQLGWSSEGLIALWAVVSGSFLHIATTIFFEASPDHHLNVRKFLASLLGAILADIFEFVL